MTFRPNLADCSGRNAAVGRRPRGRSAWLGRAAQVARDVFSLDIIFHDSMEWPDAVRLRTVSQGHSACDYTH